MLTIPEELYLLAFDEEKCTLVKSANQSIYYALSGGILADLTLQNKIRLNDKGRLEVNDPDQLSEPILDIVLRKINSHDKPRRVGYWLSAVHTKPKKLRRKVEQSLVDKGILLREDDRFTGIASTEGNQDPLWNKYSTKAELRAGILSGKPVGIRSLALLDLLRSCRLLPLLFTADEMNMARRRIKEAIVREALGNPIAQSIEEIGAAISSGLSDI